MPKMLFEENGNLNQMRKTQMLARLTKDVGILSRGANEVYVMKGILIGRTSKLTGKVNTFNIFLITS